MEVQAGNPFRCVTVLICYLGINILDGHYRASVHEATMVSNTRSICRGDQFGPYGLMSLPVGRLLSLANGKNESCSEKVILAPQLVDRLDRSRVGIIGCHQRFLRLLFQRFQPKTPRCRVELFRRYSEFVPLNGQVLGSQSIVNAGEHAPVSVKGETEKRVLQCRSRPGSGRSTCGAENSANPQKERTDPSARFMRCGGSLATRNGHLETRSSAR